MYLHRGWKTFARAHSLSEGHVLQFKLMENGLLSVKVFGRSGTRLGCCVESSTDNETSSSSHSDEDDGDTDDDGSGGRMPIPTPADHRWQHHHLHRPPPSATRLAEGHPRHALHRRVPRRPFFAFTCRT